MNSRGFNSLLILLFVLFSIFTKSCSTSPIPTSHREEDFYNPRESVTDTNSDTKNNSNIDADLVSESGDKFMTSNLASLNPALFFPPSAQLQDSSSSSDLSSTDTIPSSPMISDKFHLLHKRMWPMMLNNLGISKKKLEEMPEGTTNYHQGAVYNGDDSNTNNVTIDDEKNVSESEHTKGPFIPLGLKKYKVVNPEGSKVN
ncbi:hypothetical protein G9A89_008419 [Geosiphon pyriformis]|nr:hypothetical protein G9A89_008419 [Geosiphon pyriformis]